MYAIDGSSYAVFSSVGTTRGQGIDRVVVVVVVVVAAAAAAHDIYLQLSFFKKLN